MDILAGIFELLGVWLIGNKNKYGFLVFIASALFWIIVSLKTGVYGLLIAVIPNTILNAYNFRKWSKET